MMMMVLVEHMAGKIGLADTVAGGDTHTQDLEG